MRHELRPRKFYYNFGIFPEALRISPGDSVVTWIVDSRNVDERGEEIPEEMRHMGESSPCPVNPLVGPIHVEGAQEGDTLSISIERIRLTRPYAFSTFSAGYGGSKDRSVLALSLLSALAPVRDATFRWSLHPDERKATLDLQWSTKRSVSIDLHPFIGTIGTASRFGQALSSLVPGEHGGNMDLSDVCEGAEVFLPVFAPGGLIYVGDVHAAQGDGELGGVALETTAEVQIRVRLLKGKRIRWPRVETQEHLITVGSAGKTEDALRIAFVEMIEWMQEDFGFDPWEAAQVLTQVCTIKVANVCNPNHTTALKVPRGVILLNA
jgi:acetamidase/formamidase